MKARVIIPILAILLGVGIFFAAQRAHQKVSANAEIYQAFNTWSKSYRKLYATPSEFNNRLTIFAINYKKIQQTLSDKSLTYKVGLNKFSDLTEEEFVAKYTGYKHRKVSGGVPHVNRGVPNDEVDWRKQGAVNAVKDQKQCGSCWAFSAVAPIEAAWKIAGKDLENFSEQQLVDCSDDFGNYGCDGGLMNNAFTYLLDPSVGGIMRTSDYPYKAVDQDCMFDKSKVVGQLKTFTVIAENDCDGLLHAITTAPVSVAIAANAIMSYTSGVFNNPRCGVQLNHGVTAIGYGADKGVEFYLVRNSWGPDWGEQGYIRMYRDDKPESAGMCGICLASSYPVVRV